MARFVKGMVPWNKGLVGFNSGPRDQQWKDNIRAGLKKTYDERGRKSRRHTLMRKSVDYERWREQVFSRDQFQCRQCQSKERIHPHHIVGLAENPSMAYVVENGVTLCSVCHGKIHGMDFSLYGKWLTCQFCGLKFKSKGGHLKQKYCSRRCHYDDMIGKDSPIKGRKMPHRQRARIGHCLECQTEYRAVGDYKSRRQKYCSHACYLKHRWGFYGQEGRANPQEMRQ